MYKIKKSDGVIDRNQTKKLKYPFNEMEIGDYFETEIDDHRAPIAAFAYGKRHNKKFIQRKQANGAYRIYRVELSFVTQYSLRKSNKPV